MDSVLGSLYAYRIAADTSAQIQEVYDGIKMEVAGGLYSEAGMDADFLSQLWQPIERGDCTGNAVVSDHLYAPHTLCLEELTPAKRAMYNDLVRRFIRLQPSVQARIDAFVDEHFTSDVFVVGVHYRGNEKAGEAHRASYGDVLQAINAAVATNVDGKEVRYFVATDEGAFLAFMLERFPKQTLYLPGVCRSSEVLMGAGIQHVPHEKSALHATMDMYLLARTSHLVRTESNLSRWSTYINLNLPTTQVSFFKPAVRSLYMTQGDEVTERNRVQLNDVKRRLDASQRRKAKAGRAASPAATRRTRKKGKTKKKARRKKGRKTRAKKVKRRPRARKARARAQKRKRKKR
jgi:hypothetical protein